MVELGKSEGGRVVEDRADCEEGGMDEEVEEEEEEVGVEEVGVPEGVCEVSGVVVCGRVSGLGGTCASLLNVVRMIEEGARWSGM